MTVLSHDELIDWIRLARTPGIGGKTFRFEGTFAVSNPLPTV